jgi:hypothetical protein
MALKTHKDVCKKLVGPVIVVVVVCEYSNYTQVFRSRFTLSRFAHLTSISRNASMHSTSKHVQSKNMQFTDSITLSLSKSKRCRC